MNKCIFESKKEGCAALNEKKCYNCSFYLTEEQLNEKMNKVVEWYADKGISYNDIVIGIQKGNYKGVNNER